MKIYDTLDLTEPGVVIGQHGIWLPDRGIKIPFQWGGRVQKYRKPLEASYPLDLIAEEVALLHWLSDHRMAPPIGDWVYFKTVISEHPGAWWADPCGAYGYEMCNAHDLAPGRAAVEGLPVADRIRNLALSHGDLITGSPGAWNDLNKPGNVVNGYLVDARRSGWDRLRWNGALPVMPRFWEDRDLLRADLRRDGQFPFRERDLPYQEFYLGQWFPGERDVRTRAKLLTFLPLVGETVLDCGTQIGGFLHHAVLGTAPFEVDGHPARAWYVGIDSQPEYVDLARRLARANGWNLCFRQMDLGTEAHRLVAWLALLWGQGPDHCLLLSMTKHLPGTDAGVWTLHDLIRPGMLYLETNAVKPDTYPLRPEVEARGGRYVGDSHDRNCRRLYVVPGAPSVVSAKE